MKTMVVASALLSAILAVPALAAQHGHSGQEAQGGMMQGQQAQDGSMQGGQGGGMMGGGMMGGKGPGMMGGMRMMMILADTDEDGALSLDEVQAVHARMFRAADADDDGRLTLEEMQSFMH